MDDKSKIFDTNVFFSGGGGLFIQYHDIVKPTYLWAILKLIIDKASYNLPIDIISHMSTLSIIEWYIKRRSYNPLLCLDLQNNYSTDQLDDMLSDILNNDYSLYDISPKMNIHKMLSVYHKQHMNFPIIIYSNKEERYLSNNTDNIFPNIKTKYAYGNIDDVLKEYNKNFTFMISDIELLKQISDKLTGVCAHIVLSNDYRYNYLDNHRTFKYNLYEISKSHPFLRIDAMSLVDHVSMILAVKKILDTHNCNRGVMTR